MKALEKLDYNLLLFAIIYYSGIFWLYQFPGHHEFSQTNFNLTDILIAVPFALFGLFLISSIKKMSAINIFVLIYILLVYFPFFLFFSIKLGSDLTLGNASLVALPTLITFFQGRLDRKFFSSVGILNDLTLDSILIGIAAVSALLTLYFMPESSSFSYADFTRRLDARLVFTGGLAYLNEGVMNALIPFAAFRSFYKKRYLLSVVCIILVIIFYYSYGVKSTIGILILSILCGYFAERSSMKKSSNVIAAVFIGLVCIAACEIILQSDSKLIRFFFRRFHYVMAFNVQAYLDCFSLSDFSFFGLWGMNIDTPASMYIGEVFLRSKDLNANTNTFMYYLIQYGLPGYLFALLSVWAVLVFLDLWDDQTPMKAYIASVFCLLIVEKSFTTALLSSGLLMVTLLYFLSINHIKSSKDN